MGISSIDQLRAIEAELASPQLLTPNFKIWWHRPLESCTTIEQHLRFEEQSRESSANTRLYQPVVSSGGWDIPTPARILINVYPGGTHQQLIPNVDRNFGSVPSEELHVNEPGALSEKRPTVSIPTVDGRVSIVNRVVSSTDSSGQLKRTSG